MPRPHPNCLRFVRPRGAPDAALISLMLWTFTLTSEARAADMSPAITGFGKSEFDLPSVPPRRAEVPAAPGLAKKPFDSRLPLDEHPSFSAEFRPHGPSILGNDAKDMVVDQTQHGSVWQRLGEFRTHNRLRLLTLWQTGGNSLSLQAGRKGDPTLQWTTRLSHREAEDGGLFDELLSASGGGAIGKGLHLLPHFSPLESAAKPVKSAEAALSASASGK